uniref:Uncharacterized protein n=1 Tax=Cannabis sativa TaxID=3483 RepID=A0A803QRS0_CANSA
MFRGDEIEKFESGSSHQQRWILNSQAGQFMWLRLGRMRFKLRCKAARLMKMYKEEKGGSRHMLSNMKDEDIGAIIGSPGFKKEDVTLTYSEYQSMQRKYLSVGIRRFSSGENDQRIIVPAKFHQPSDSITEGCNGSLLMGTGAIKNNWSTRGSSILPNVTIEC